MLGHRASPIRSAPGPDRPTGLVALPVATRDRPSGTVAGVVVEHLGQVPAQDLDVRDEPVAAVVVSTEVSSTFPSTSI
jgi:hypothetical protein